MKVRSLRDEEGAALSYNPWRRSSGKYCNCSGENEL